MASDLPPELIIMIFRSTNDQTTMKNIRASSRIGYDSIKKADLFHTLRLRRNRRHAANKIMQMTELGLTGYVNSLIVGTSCYASPLLFKDRSEGLLDDLYGGKRDGNKMTEHDKLYGKEPLKVEQEDAEGSIIERTVSFDPHLRNTRIKFEVFLMYVLRVLGKPDTGNQPKQIRIEMQSDTSDEELSNDLYIHQTDHILAKYSEIYWVRLLLAQCYAAFSHVLQRLFTMSPSDRSIDILEVRYQMRYCDYFLGKWTLDDEIGYRQEDFSVLKAFSEGTGKLYNLDVRAGVLSKYIFVFSK